MSKVRKEVCLRKQLLTRIFLQTLTRDEDNDFYNEPSTHETPSRKAVQLPDQTTGKQPTVPDIKEQNIMKRKIQNEENTDQLLTEPVKKKLKTCHDSENDILSEMKSNGNEHNHAYAETETELTGSCYISDQKTKKSKKKAFQKYSRILYLIEGLERRIAAFCDKENEDPMDVSAPLSSCNIPRLECIKSSCQKEKYEKYHSKTLKACKDLEAKISLYSQYIETLEIAVKSIPEGSEIYKMLQAKVIKAQKFHLENPLHNEAKELDHQCKLINALLKRFSGYNSS